MQNILWYNRWERNCESKEDRTRKQEQKKTNDNKNN